MGVPSKEEEGYSGYHVPLVVINGLVGMSEVVTQDIAIHFLL
jgi:hypothetical protein